MAYLATLGKYRNTGLLIIRIGLGIMFMMHGYPELLGGPEKWESIGGAIKFTGIDFLPVMWGLISAMTETFGGFLFLLGLAFRPVCILLTINMALAAAMHLNQGDGVMGASQAIELGFVVFGMALIGPGRYSADKK